MIELYTSHELHYGLHDGGRVVYMQENGQRIWDEWKPMWQTSANDPPIEIDLPQFQEKWQACQPQTAWH